MTDQSTKLRSRDVENEMGFPSYDDYYSRTNNVSFAINSQAERINTRRSERPTNIRNFPNDSMMARLFNDEEVKTMSASPERTGYDRNSSEFMSEFEARLGYNLSVENLRETPIKSNNNFIDRNSDYFYGTREPAFEPQAAEFRVEEADAMNYYNEEAESIDGKDADELWNRLGFSKPNHKIIFADDEQETRRSKFKIKSESSARAGKAKAHLNTKGKFLVALYAVLFVVIATLVILNVNDVTAAKAQAPTDTGSVYTQTAYTNEIEPLKSNYSYATSTNWFDSLCDKLSK